MSSVSQIRAAIAAQIEAAGEVGKVHTFERYANDDRAVTNYFVWPGNDPDRNHLRGWQIRWESSTEEGKTYPETTLVTHRWKIIALMSLIDAWESGLIFDSMIERVRERFRRDRTLGGIIEVSRAENQNGLQVIDNGASQIAGILCHVAELRLETAVEFEATSTAVLDDFLTTDTVFELPGLPEGMRLPVAMDQQDMRDEQETT